jgi:hypothetical protein|tara:strand:+ start:49 stop:279 length:231 start_codon:yes stop_codon:yes gene_type:complete
MNINDDYQEESPSSEQVMQAMQSVLFDMVIEPMQEKLNIDDFKVLDMIGETLKAISEKATAYEHLNETNLEINYRN